MIEILPPKAKRQLEILNGHIMMVETIHVYHQTVIITSTSERDH